MPDAPMRILVVCTANRCRSPMAEALLRSHLARLGAVGVETSSSGRLEDGVPATKGAVRAVAGLGLDLRSHRSRYTTTSLVGGADLVVCMAREHVRDVVGTDDTAFERTFTLRELVRRGLAVGPRGEQTIADWLALVGAGRTRDALLGADPSDDVADPIGQPDAAYRATAGELDELTRTLAELLVG
jgi:protein-tyrosine phosphatase